MERKLNFVNGDGLGKKMASYWSEFFFKNLKIGVEIECDSSCYDQDEEMGNLEDLLMPTNDIARFGEYGVYKVDSDGSLRNGFEICTVGRRVNFETAISQYKFIIDSIPDKELNARCGLHNHMLLSYNDRTTALEKNVPPQILINFLQLTRRHFPELAFITSTVCTDYDERILTRSSYFCKQGSLMRNNPVDKDLKDIKSVITGSDRYKAVNLSPMEIDNDNNEITKFHMELRFPDGSIYPIQIAAQNVLYMALILKAVKLSEYGMVSVGDDFEETKELSEAFRNEGIWDYNDRYSNPVSNKTVEKLKGRAVNLIEFLKPEICKISTKAYAVLNHLAKEPVSLMARENFEDEVDYERINKILEGLIKEETLVNQKEIEKLIACMSITGQKDKRSWVKKASEEVKTSQVDVSNIITKLKEGKQIVFDKAIGTFLEI